MSLFSSIGRIAGQIGGAAIGFATGGVGGAIAGSGIFKPPGSVNMVPTSPGGGLINTILNAGPKIQMPFPVNGPGGIPLPGYGGTLGGGQAPANGQCPRGYHLNKKPLGATKGHGPVPARSMCVRNRSLNALNPRAVTRSLKRIKRARKLIGKLHAFGPSRQLTRGGGRGHRAGCGCAVCRRR